MQFDGQRILITGGTGSLGQRLVHRLLSGEQGVPAQVTVFSRDEAKQHHMRLSYLQQPSATDDTIYKASGQTLRFIIGDVRDYPSVARAVANVDIVFHAAALKQVPTCEYFPMEATKTNVGGVANLVRAITETNTSIRKVIGVSTDKACQPLTVMGMTKALQERVLIQANLMAANTSFLCVRYGNVIASRGSVVPLFLEQIRKRVPVTITVKEMTRFLISLDQAVDALFAATSSGFPGEIYVPKIPSARIVDLARALAGETPIDLVYTGIRSSEKLHEVLISGEEATRSVERHGYFVIRPDLPELLGDRPVNAALQGDYSSGVNPMGLSELRDFLRFKELHSPTTDGIYSGED